MPGSIEKLLQALLEEKGSDLHLMAGLPPAIRVHGKLIQLDDVPPFTPHSLHEAIYSILKPDQITRFEESAKTRHELDFAYGVSGVGRFRFNIHRQRGSIAAVIRAVPDEVPRMKDLHLPPQVEQLANLSKGLVLVTGPTGSGKSTTLAAIIDAINENRPDHIITVEDPIEFLHNSKKSYVTQREVGEHGDTMSFSNALRAALRQDPDVILVGEMRDYETISIALTAAETGHLVFGTLHTPSAPQTVSRIIDVFPPSQQPQVTTQLSSTLVAVVAQVLLPTADGRGRTVAMEIMRTNSAIRSLIRENKVSAIYQSMEMGTKDGMVTMDKALIELVSTGQVNYEDALPYIHTPVARKQLEPYRDTAYAA